MHSYRGIHRTKWIGFPIVGIFVGGLVVMLIWNAIIPDLFHGPLLGYWQAVGLLALTHIFFRSGGCWHGGHREHWRRRWEAKLASLSPEDREKLRAEWQRRCGYPQDTADPPTGP